MNKERNAKPSRNLWFPDWPRELQESEFSEVTKESYAVTLRWYMSFCKRSRAGINKQSANDFIEMVRREKPVSETTLELYREAIRWFFRNAKRQPRDASEKSAANSPPAAERSATEEEPISWKDRMRRVIRVRHYSYRTEETYLYWVGDYARFLHSESLGNSLRQARNGLGNGCGRVGRSASIHELVCIVGITFWTALSRT